MPLPGHSLYEKKIYQQNPEPQSGQTGNFFFLREKERDGMTRSKGPKAGFEPAAAADIGCRGPTASVDGADDLPTELNFCPKQTISELTAETFNREQHYKAL